LRSERPARNPGLKRRVEREDHRQDRQNHKGASNKGGKPETFHGRMQRHHDAQRVSDMVSEYF
jgi:hypothetical protein